MFRRKDKKDTGDDQRVESDDFGQGWSEYLLRQLVRGTERFGCQIVDLYTEIHGQLLEIENTERRHVLYGGIVQFGESGARGLIPIAIHLVQEGASNYSNYEEHCASFSDVVLQEDERIFGSVVFDGRYQGRIGSKDEKLRPGLSMYLYLRSEERDIIQSALTMPNIGSTDDMNRIILSVRAQVPDSFDQDISGAEPSPPRLPIIRFRMSALSSFADDVLKLNFMVEPELE